MKSTLSIPGQFIAMLVVSAAITGCVGPDMRTATPSRHPQELSSGGRVDCLDCHDDEVTGTLKNYGTFRHSNSFLLNHGAYGSQDRNLCSSCHSESFCLECHATTEVLGPDLRRGDRPGRMNPHRGEYITRHQLDGRVDPGSCVRCHGNRNDAGCAVCH